MMCESVYVSYGLRAFAQCAWMSDKKVLCMCNVAILSSHKASINDAITARLVARLGMDPDRFSTILYYAHGSTDESFAPVLREIIAEEFDAVITIGPYATDAAYRFFAEHDAPLYHIGAAVSAEHASRYRARPFKIIGYEDADPREYISFLSECLPQGGRIACPYQGSRDAWDSGFFERLRGVCREYGWELVPLHTPSIVVSEGAILCDAVLFIEGFNSPALLREYAGFCYATGKPLVTSSSKAVESGMAAIGYSGDFRSLADAIESEIRLYAEAGMCGMSYEPRIVPVPHSFSINTVAAVYQGLRPVATANACRDRGGRVYADTDGAMYTGFRAAEGQSAVV